MSEASPSPSDYFAQDHRRCDSLWVEVEAAIEKGTAEDIAGIWRRFEYAMRRHLEMEEKVLFPSFEARTGMTEGPTSVMRGEHEQMRGVLDQMKASADVDDRQELLDLGDTLMLLIQQHNQKEENMLYPMCDRALASQWAELEQQLERFPIESP